MSKVYCNMTMLGLTPASKPMRSSAPLAGQQFHMPPIRQTWHCLTSICLGPSKKVCGGDISPVMKRSKLLLRKCLKLQPVEFYNERICGLIKRWEKAVQKVGDYIEK